MKSNAELALSLAIHLTDNGVPLSENPQYFQDTVRVRLEECLNKVNPPIQKSAMFAVHLNGRVVVESVASDTFEAWQRFFAIEGMGHFLKGGTDEAERHGYKLGRVAVTLDSEDV